MSEPRPWPVFDMPNPLPADGTVLHEWDGWRWVADAASETGVRAEMVPGGTAANERTISDAARTAIAVLETAAQNWDSLTPAQKDTALRLTVRAAARLIRLALRELDSA